MNIETTAMESSKIFAKNNIKPPVEGRCGFFVKRKQRYCKMKPTKGNQFCAEHAQFDKEQDEGEKRKRIPCPLDPKHSVFEDKLSSHMKKCNATKKTNLPFFDKNINIGINHYIRSEKEKLRLYEVPIDELKNLIEKLRDIHKKVINLISQSENTTIHQLLSNEIETQKDCGQNVKKHLVQQGSLIQILDDNEFFRHDVNVIEFGAGRGALSHWVQKAMSSKEGSQQYFLIDRQHNRNKLDCYHKGEDQGPNFQRLNIDIINLNLNKVDALVKDNGEVSNILAIGKHLCGGATDLSLRCLLNDQNNKSNSSGEEPSEKRSKTTNKFRENLHGILFALCCYHRCTWDTYVGLDFMQKHDVTPTQFHFMTKMATWSTCGFERRQHEDHIADDESDETNTLNEGKIHHKLKFSIAEQEEIGHMCKLLIDYGRIQYIESRGFKPHLVKYISRDVTPENIALLVNK
ncbi:tRNA:m(4)X modification enzyme TRM13 homolog [Clytia hemisphaerica]|uniref:tRNA:m(4)X modification enzyme TRM13 n=1 Tax=Clytia hemisphaerica TaxID=252671 RepID=A0A7M5X728_9CNID